MDVELKADGELKAKALEYLTLLEDAVKQSADFTAEQVPYVLQEMLALEFYTALCWLLIGAVPLAISYIAGGVILTTYFRHLNKTPDDEFTRLWPRRDLKLSAVGIATAILLVLTVIFAPMAVNGTLRIVKVQAAPRVFLIEEITDLIK